VDVQIERKKDAETMTFVRVPRELVIVGFHRKLGLSNEAHMDCEEPFNEIFGAWAEVFIVEIFGFHVGVVKFDCSIFCCNDDVERVGRVTCKICDCQERGRNFDGKFLVLDVIGEGFFVVGCGPAGWSFVGRCSVYRGSVLLMINAQTCRGTPALNCSFSLIVVLFGLSLSLPTARHSSSSTFLQCMIFTSEGMTTVVLEMAVSKLMAAGKAGAPWPTRPPTVTEGMIWVPPNFLQLWTNLIRQWLLASRTMLSESLERALILSFFAS
jgi:hypothetical protein